MAGRSSGATLAGSLPIAAVVVMLAALGIRGVTGVPKQLPNQREVPQVLSSPLQLLSSAAELRLGELAPRLGAQYRSAWIDTCRIPFRIQACPGLIEWIPTADGQKVERLIGDLRHGGPEEAFASLVLVFQVAHGTHWHPGLLGKSANAERMGLFLQEWLADWAPEAADDPLLFEPAMAALLLYSRVMRTAYDAPALGFDEAPFERAKQFLEQLTGAREPRRTAFGEALTSYSPTAFKDFLEREDFLRGFEKEALVKFPELDGKCDR